MTAIPAGQDVTGTRQLAAWRELLIPPVEQLAADLWSIPVPTYRVAEHAVGWPAISACAAAR
jgi:hypothetical protein